MAAERSVFDFLLDYLYRSNSDCSFDNECATQLNFHHKIGNSEIIQYWLKNSSRDTSHKSSEKSDKYREQGNRLIKQNKSVYALEASRFYTHAIFAAPCGSIALPLAHANRAIAISEFGYYKEAYEDCECAVDYGYPEENLQKIVIRQASYANKLNDFDKLKFCLLKLRKMELSERVAKRHAKLEEALVKLQEKETHVDAGAGVESGGDYMNQHILSNPWNRKYMSASKDIGKGEDVFSETAFSLFPRQENKTKICPNCATQNIIPFPCNMCAKVYYCSIKCREAGKTVHQYECPAYLSDFFITIPNLPMKTMLIGLPSILPSLRDCPNAYQIWRKIESIAKSGDKGYSAVLSLPTNLHSIDTEELIQACIIASFSAQYLKNFTAFFTLFEGSACGLFDWMVIVSALVMRHSGQERPTAHYSVSLGCTLNYEFPALYSIWEKPQHVKKGLLQSFSAVDSNYSGFFPYLGVCTNSCDPSIIPRFDGNRVIGTACQDIKRGTEICITYIADKRQLCRLLRHADCMVDCKSCLSSDSDFEYLQFHTYCCPRCKATFSRLSWFQIPLGFDKCPACRSDIDIRWYFRFLDLVKDPTQLREVLQIFSFSRNYFMGFNELRQEMAIDAVKCFFEARKRNLLVSQSEIKEVRKALDYCLNTIELQHGVESVLYASRSTYALDLMAQEEFFKFDCRKIYKSLKMLSNEMRIIFENYIGDYLGEQFSF